MTPRITSTGRSTDRPPPYAPYNFGINQEWYVKFKDKPAFQILLRGWGSFGDPPGFGTNAPGLEEDEEPAPGPLSSPREDDNV